MEHKITVIIAEDTLLIRRLLMMRLIMEPDIEVVGEAENGQDAVHLTGELNPDIILRDMDMPVLNGIQAAEQIVARSPKIRILLLTAHYNLLEVGMRFGAAACLHKGCTPTELIDAIRTAYRERDAAQVEAGVTGLLAVIERMASLVNLTDREKSVVQRMVLTDDTASQIAAALQQEWNQKVTEASVKHTLERAMTKLNTEPRNRAALLRQMVSKLQSSRED